MMKNIYIIIAAAIIGCTCIWIWRVVDRWWIRPKKLQRWLMAQGFKGNPYRLWHGDTKEMARMIVAAHSKPMSLDVDDGGDHAPYILPFHHHLVTKYGKRSLMWHGPQPRIMIMDPDMIKDVLNKYETFEKLVSSPWTRLLVTGLVIYEGQKWAKHRRLLNPSFTAAKLKDMVPAMHISCNNLMKELVSTVSNEGFEEVDVWPLLTKFTADVISRTAFGSNYKEGEKIFFLQREQTKLLVQLNSSVYIPGSRFLPTKINKRMKELDREIVKVLKGIIENKHKAMKSGAQNSNDMLGILMESNSMEAEDDAGNKNMEITIEEVIDECKLFYIAGQETTSNLLVWIIVMLSVHQNWQTEAREEVFEVFGKDMPGFDSLPQLKKMNMIIHEVLRLYPPAPTALRTAKENTKLGDISIPRGVEIILPTVLVHQDKEIWGDDAKEFKPERFAQGVAKATRGHLAAFFPFSLGPRICIGMNFAMVEVKLVLAMMLQRYVFQLSPRYEHAPVPIITLHPKFGAKIMFRKIGEYMY